MIFSKKFIKLKSFDSKKYWETRYSKGGNSGAGSYGQLAEFKAEIINQFIKKNDIKTIIEWGCGDGSQLTYMNYQDYIGFDVSKTVVFHCSKKFKDDKSKTFLHTDKYTNQSAVLSLSLDVIFHLIEDSIYNDYMNRLFNSSQKFVVIYYSNTSEQFEIAPNHLYQRKFTDWIQKNKSDFKLIKKIKNRYPYNQKFGEGSVSDFFIYKK